MGEPLPPGYQVVRYLYAPSRWIVSYQGNPHYFVEKVNALGEERIKTFKTKAATIQALREHLEQVAELERLAVLPTQAARYGLHSQ